MTKSSSSGSTQPRHPRHRPTRGPPSDHAKMERTLLAGAGAWDTNEVLHEGTRTRTGAPQLIETNTPSVRIAAYASAYESMYPTDIQLERVLGGHPMVRSSQTFHYTRPVYHFDPDPQPTECQLAAREFTKEALTNFYQPQPVNNNEIGDWIPSPICNPSAGAQSSADGSGWFVVPAPAGDIDRDTQGMGAGVAVLTDNGSYSNWDYITKDSEAQAHLDRSG